MLLAACRVRAPLSNDKPSVWHRMHTEHTAYVPAETMAHGYVV